MNSETKIVYFDTNVFDHIERHLHGVTDWDLYVLRRAVKDEKIAIVLSFLNVEETLFIVESQPERAQARIKLILGLASNRLFVKSQELIIGDDMRSYALNAPSVPPFFDLDPHMELVICNAVYPAGSMLLDIQAIIDEVDRDKQSFKAFLEEGKKKLLPYAEEIGTRAYKFDRYFGLNSGWLAEGLAKRAGVGEECRKRGIEGLLKIKSVRLAVGANLSLMYAHHFENVTPRQGDSRDILHAVLASTADIFVTHDATFANTLRRVPIDGFRVYGIHSLVTALDRRGAPQWGI